MGSLFWHELRSRRGAIIGWGIGLGLYGALYLTAYPGLAEQFGAMDLGDIAIYKAFGMEDFSTFASFMAASFGNLLPVVFGIYALATGTAALAGEEDNGTLELVAAAPVARWQIVVGKALAMSLVAAAVLLITGIILALSFLIMADQIQTNLTVADLIGSALYAWPLTLLLMMISLWLGAYLPNRRVAVIVATLVLLVGYLGNNLLALAPSLQDLRIILPFHYYDGRALLVDGRVSTGDIGVLLTAAVVFLALALLSFQRRNLTVGAWPWVRARVAG